MNNSSDFSFFELVYEVVRLIPAGRVSTYGAIATAIGRPGSARMVGMAMNNSHTIDIPVPAHRVVNRIGLLTGKAHFSSPLKMQELLESEGVIVLNDKVIKFNEVFWDPLIEL